MSRTRQSRKQSPADVRMVVEVDGSPVGFLELDIDRLWPLVNHRKWDRLQIEWLDPKRFEGVMRAAAVRSLLGRVQSHLYKTLGKEIVNAELDVESFVIKAEAAGQAFGRTRKDIQKLTAAAGRTLDDFYAFFWDYMLDEREGVDPKKKWKAAGRKPGNPA
jgi:hypothetical protein